MSVPAQPVWSDRPQTPGQRVKWLREYIGFSTVAAARALNISDQTWRNYESGASPLKEPTLMAICAAFEKDADKARVLREWIKGDGAFPTAAPQPPEETLRLSRDLDGAGHEPYPAGNTHFSGSDIEKLCTAGAVSAA